VTKQVARLCSDAKLIKKEILNDQRFREKKTLIFQAEIGWIRDTLFDHLVTRGSKDKG
jgi:hypothetical protein